MAIKLVASIRNYSDKKNVVTDYAYLLMIAVEANTGRKEKSITP